MNKCTWSTFTAMSITSISSSLQVSRMISSAASATSPSNTFPRYFGEKSFSGAFLLENMGYNGPIYKIKQKSPVKLRKETRIIEIKQNFRQKSVIYIKMEKQKFYPGKVSERSSERRALFLLTIFLHSVSFTSLVKLSFKPSNSVPAIRNCKTERALKRNVPAGSRTRILGSASPKDIHYHTGTKELAVNNLHTCFALSWTVTFNE